MGFFAIVVYTVFVVFIFPLILSKQQIINQCAQIKSYKCIICLTFFFTASITTVCLIYNYLVNENVYKTDIAQCKNLQNILSLAGNLHFISFYCH